MSSLKALLLLTKVGCFYAKSGDVATCRVVCIGLYIYIYVFMVRVVMWQHVVLFVLGYIYIYVFTLRVVMWQHVVLFVLGYIYICFYAKSGDVAACRVVCIGLYIYMFLC